MPGSVNALVPPGSVDEMALRADFRDQQRHAAGHSARYTGLLGIVLVLAWSVLDHVLLPDRAEEFRTVRLAVTAVMGIGVALLSSPRFGRRWPEQVAFVVLLAPQIGIAWMIPGAVPRLEAYLLGFSLAVYASGFLVTWRWQLTATLLAASTGATAAAFAVQEVAVTPAQLTTVAVYLATAGAIALATQVYRQRAAWRQLVVSRALVNQHEENTRLVTELSLLSYADPLTGVANRRAWEERMGEQVRRARASGRALSILYCDLDHFKDVNDRWGHEAGDQVLRHASGLLTGRLRGGDEVARLGGDEFAVCCPDTALPQALALADQLVALARTSRWPAGALVTFSVGVAELSDADVDARALLSRADAALYAAKKARDSASGSPLRAAVQPTA